MASRSRHAGWVGLVLGSAFLFAVGCGSSDSKPVNSTPSPADGGAAGAAEAGAAGIAASAGNVAGAAGSSGDSAGASGASSSSGAPGIGGEAGAGGEGPLGCVPAGVATNVTLPSEPIYQVCRGRNALADIEQLGGLTQATFTCCAVSDTTPAYTVKLAGERSGEDVGGRFQFALPEDAPLGGQTLSVACALGPVETPIALEVYDAPFVLSVNAQIFPSDTMIVKGYHLQGVTIEAVPTAGTGPAQVCEPLLAAAPVDTAISCRFGNITPGQYLIRVSNAACDAPSPPEFEVLAPAR